MKTPENKPIIIAIVSCLACVLIGAFAFVFVLDMPGKDSKAGSPAEQQSTAPSATDPHKATTDPHKATTDPKNAKYIVYVETGHGLDDEGKWDTGCSWSDGSKTYQEADVMLPIAKAMVSYLRKSGVKVYTDADEDNNKNLAQTLDFLDEHREVDAFINLHCDWAEAASGTMPLYKTDEQLALAKALNEGVHSCVDIPDRGPAYRDDLETLTNEKVHCNAVLFESGSIKADNTVLTKEYDAYGKGLAKGLCQYLGVSFVD